MDRWVAQGYLKVLAFGGKVGHCESQGLRDMLPKRPERLL